MKKSLIVIMGFVLPTVNAEAQMRPPIRPGRPPIVRPLPPRPPMPRPRPVPQPIPRPVPAPVPAPLPPRGDYHHILNQLEAQLRSANWRERQAAVQQLAYYPVPRALFLAVSAAGDSDADVRNSAQNSLDSLMQSVDRYYHFQELLSSGTQSLASSNWRVRMVAAKVLGSLNSALPLAALIQRSGDSDADVRREVGRAIDIALDSQDLFQVVQSQLSVFVSLLNSNNWRERQQSAVALGRARAVEATLALVQRAGDLDRDVTNAVNQALELLGSLPGFRMRGAYLVSSIGQELISSRNWRVRVAAARTLGKLGGMQARQYLYQGISDIDADVRRAVQNALDTMDY